MTIILIYLIGVVLSYMRVNAVYKYWKQRGAVDHDAFHFFITFITMCSWIGFLIGAFFFIMEREEGEKFFKL